MTKPTVILLDVRRGRKGNGPWNPARRYLLRVDSLVAGHCDISTVICDGFAQFEIHTMGTYRVRE